MSKASKPVAAAAASPAAAPEASKKKKRKSEIDTPKEVPRVMFITNTSDYTRYKINCRYVNEEWVRQCLDEDEHMQDYECDEEDCENCGDSGNSVYLDCVLSGHIDATTVMKEEMTGGGGNYIDVEQMEKDGEAKVVLVAEYTPTDY
jgi:hypothetical protein